MKLFFWRKPASTALKCSEVVCYPDVMALSVMFAGSDKEFERTTTCPHMKKKLLAVMQWLKSGADTSFVLEHNKGSFVFCRSNIAWASIKTVSRD